MASAEDHAAENDGVYAISVWSWPDMTAEEIALRVKENRGADRNPLGHGKIRESAVGRIYGAAHPGFSLVQSDEDGHYDLILPSPPSEEVWDALELMFDPAQPNPASDRR